MSISVSTIKEMLLSEDEQTFILGIRILLNTDIKDINIDISKYTLEDIKLYYDFLYDLNISSSPMWNVIKHFPINRKFCRYNTLQELLYWNIYE